MYSLILYVVGVFLTVAIAMVMLLRHRAPSSCVVAFGAGINVFGHIAQAFSTPIEITERNSDGELVSSYFSLGTLFAAGSAVTLIGWAIFLLGLLWYFLSLRRRPVMGGSA
jgi:hypothetical protein